SHFKGHGRFDAARLGDRGSGRRARRQCRRRAGRQHRACRRREDRRLSQRAGPAGGVRLGALRQEPAHLRRNAHRQEREEASGQLGRRAGEAYAADARRCGRASEFPAEGGLRRAHMENVAAAVDPFVFRLSIFVLAVFVGYYVVWSVTPALHTPLMSVTNAISSVIVVGALLAVGVALVANDQGPLWARALGFVALVFASVNIFGGFLVTQRMLAMYQKKKK